MLVGREDERRHLDRLLRQARAGTSGTVMLRGEPGIGKTALVGYVASCAETMRILSVTGSVASARTSVEPEAPEADTAPHDRHRR